MKYLWHDLTKCNVHMFCKHFGRKIMLNVCWH